MDSKSDDADDASDADGHNAAADADDADRNDNMVCRQSPRRGLSHSKIAFEKPAGGDGKKCLKCLF